jgi:hypothetical protein
MAMSDETDAGSEASDEVVARVALGALFLLTCVGLAVGLCSFHPYLEREHRRLEPWKGVLVWVGDAAGLAWFAHYFVGHFLLRRPFRPARRRPAGARYGSVALFSLLFALGCDLAVSVSLMLDERAAYQAAEPAEGRVTAVKVKEYPSGFVKYDLTYHFVDRAGVGHTARYTVRDGRGAVNPAGTPAAVVGALRAGRLQFPVGVCYDPGWPERSWVRGAGWDHGDRLHYFSLCPLLFQLFCLPLFVLALRESVRRTGECPWWYDLYKVFPLLIEAAFFLLFGVVELSEQNFR